MGRSAVCGKDLTIALKIYETDSMQWSSGRIIALLFVMAILLIAFIIVQIFNPKTAMLPSRLLKQRSVVAGCWQMFFVGAGMYVVSKYTSIL